eukprot:CAMPEP_0172532930 /NCGR_PEP_ID=MMETSP1067-20121228/5797_1 /TAXON_ID=265564 ORGANISM="Thalassiosira punctigera, Strain Tpunct2005C2" /NCGR_SAMPLE_ID=MMETSP1067 /ASSEMBLY_ACC=CAM_ASM_000444 /LENGTH=244 /DNA_ID=CAMNT_0013317493 /DNA_START=110 /DNA_END=844 /DNA_ORIENTATION=-
MVDEQTADFFMPPSDDAAAFAVPAVASGEGDYYAAAPSDGDFFSPPPVVAADGSDADFFNPPPASSSEGDFFNPPPEAPAVSSDDAPIILGEPTSYEAPPAPDGVETVSDDEEDAVPSGGELVPAEPTPMAKWNDEWAVTLLRRKEEENATKASHVETARDEVAAFQAEREKRREARMAKNRSDEQDKLEAIEADLENDNSWQRVVKMIELNQDSTEGAVDTGRMKDVLVLLKNEPARADALSA